MFLWFTLFSNYDPNLSFQTWPWGLVLLLWPKTSSPQKYLSPSYWFVLSWLPCLVTSLEQRTDFSLALPVNQSIIGWSCNFNRRMGDGRGFRCPRRAAWMFELRVHGGLFTWSLPNPITPHWELSSLESLQFRPSLCHGLRKIHSDYKCGDL